MNELIQLGAHSYYIPSTTNIGIYEQNGRVFLIDSGLNAKQAEQFLALITARGWQIEAIFNTHYHADHVGGNRFLQEATGCRCFCPLSQLVRESILNPSVIYGSHPPRHMLTDVFLAQSSQTQELNETDLPAGLRIVPLHGHCAGQTGFLTDDGVLFCADVVISEEELARYRFSHVYDLQAHLASLDALEQQQALCYVPSHASALPQIHDLVETNRRSCLDLMDEILALCAGGGLNADELLRRIFNRMGRHLHLAQYALSGSTLRAYLSYLLDTGALTTRTEENLLLFCTV